MRKALLIPALYLLLSAFFFLASQTVSAQSCIPDYQSCDQNNPCCNFPSFTCQGGYCQPASPQCGTNTLPCCDPPNPQCGPGLECIGNYCVVPPQPTIQPAPRPSIPPTQAPGPTSAPPPEGTHRCYQATASVPCVPSNVACNSGYVPNFEYCSSFTSSGCNSAPATNCIPSGYDGFGPNDPRLGCPGANQINTAIGCIPVENTNEFIGFILRWAMGIGGGIAFLLIVYAGFMIVTSSGNPDRLRAGQELLTGAVAGLLLLIFSVFILEVIGVDILKLPEFGQ